MAILCQIQECLKEAVRVSENTRKALGEMPTNDAVDSGPLGFNYNSKIIEHALKRNLFHVRPLADTRPQLQVRHPLDALHQIGKSLKVVILSQLVLFFHLGADQ